MYGNRKVEDSAIDVLCQQQMGSYLMIHFVLDKYDQDLELHKDDEENGVIVWQPLLWICKHQLAEYREWFFLVLPNMDHIICGGGHDGIPQCWGPINMKETEHR